MIKAIGNSDFIAENSSGFNLEIKTTSFFNLKSLDKKTKDPAIFYTCFPVILGNIRGSMLSLLSQFPAVNRDIPLFDLTDMVKHAIKDNNED